MKRQRETLSAILKDNKIGEFDKKVYRAISIIPAGEVRSYKWIAMRIGSPKAYRAVGGALNRNPCPGIVPCHRVIKSDGSLGGYSRGAAVKRRLLAAEGIDCAGKRCYNHKISFFAYECIS